ncbi:histidine kinase [Chitinophaga sp. OAE865]|uniref:sensor histidine kinase n=1 Tax=Chitinophaga sp. OAE865 TaxID=2817898 RepID=UPI001AE5C6F2
MFIKYPILKHVIFWLCAFVLLTYIYGTAYESFELGIKVIAMLLPVHMVYLYAIDKIVVSHFYLKGQYVKAAIATLLIMIIVSFLYRVAEIFITDPYIYKFYKNTDSNFSWERVNWSKSKQLFNPILFVTAIERSNAVVWIGITLKLFSLSHERKQSALLAELNLLKAQLHPHFLFNSLNNIYSLSLEKSEKAPEVILGISNILRYSLYECNSQQVLLKRDIEILKDYIRLEQIRYEERLDLNVFISENTSSLQIAPMLMLPLVENAFKHGTAGTIDMPWINIQLHISENSLTLNISNSKPDSPLASNDSSGRIGIRNVQKRLDLLYPGKHSLKFFDEEDCFITLLHLNLSLT